MRTFFHALVLCTLPVVLAGCAGVGIHAISGPAANLRDAEVLLESQDRPLIAEKLIREAMESYRNNNDQPGLASAYRSYGFFFRSSAIEGKWSQYYRENGFLDKSARYEVRYEKSIEYFEKAKRIFADYKRFDALTNLNLNIGFTYEVMGYREAACQAFDRSLENSRESLGQMSRARVALPHGFSNYEDFLTPHKTRAGCFGRHRHPLRRDVVQAATILSDANGYAQVRSD